MAKAVINGLDSSLELFKEITDEEIKKSLNELGAKAKKIMQSASATDTGKAKKSIKSRIKKLNNGGYKLVTRFTEEYYAYQEFESEKASPENIGREYRALKNIDKDAMDIFRKLAVNDGK